MTTEPSSAPDTATWTPLLEGEDARRAWEAVRHVADELTRESAELVGRMHGSRRPGLAGGESGIGLFYAYLGLTSPDPEEADRRADQAIELLDQAAEGLSSEVTTPELYSGFTGVAWTLEHLDGLLFENEGDGQEPIDEVLLDFLDTPAAVLEYDIIQGLTGFGIYALERGGRPTGVRCLDKVVRRLDELAIRDEQGIRWFSAPERLPEHQREQNPKGNFNAGVAHGLPGVLPVLAGAAAAGVAAERASELLEGAVVWLLGHRFDRTSEEHAGCHLPYAWMPDGALGGPARLAWCYGDAGAAAALLSAARQAGREDWERQALEMAHDAAARSEEKSGIQDSGLCHGAAGLGHVFHRIYRTSGDPAFADTARFWFRWALDHRDRILADNEVKRIGGFPAWSTDFLSETLELGWREDPGFLTGAAGVGLALLGALGGPEPDWDRVLAISLPPAPSR